MLEVKCHCGACTINIPRRPRVLTACNCSMCTRIQPLFAYYLARTITVNARSVAFDSYVWGKRRLRWYRCRTCGCFTHHHADGRESDVELRTGVNLRLGDPAVLRDVEVHVRDGAADTWNLTERYRYGDLRGAIAKP